MIKFYVLLIAVFFISCIKPSDNSCVCCSRPTFVYNLDSASTYKWLVKIQFVKWEEKSQVINAHSNTGLSETYNISSYLQCESKFSQADPNSCSNNDVYTKRVSYTSSLYGYKMQLVFGYTDGLYANFFNNASLDKNNLTCEVIMNFNKKIPQQYYSSSILDFSMKSPFINGVQYGDGFNFQGYKKFGNKVYNDFVILQLNNNSGSEYLKRVYLDVSYGIIGFTFNDSTEWYIDYP